MEKFTIHWLSLEAEWCMHWLSLHSKMATAM